MQWMNKPGPVLAAGLVGVLTAGFVGAILFLASCESTGGRGVTARRGDAGVGARGVRGSPVPTTPSAVPGSNYGRGPASTGGVGGTGATGASGAGAAGVADAGGAVAAVVAGVPSVEPEIRVRVASGVTTLPLASATGMIVQSLPVGASMLELPETQASDVVMKSGSVNVTVEKGSWVVGSQRFPSGQGLVLTPTGATRSIIMSGQSHPGRLRLTLRTDASGAYGSFDVVEFVPLETYLPGVVGKEMLRNWPAESYKVQSVCARTYALHERWRSIGAGQTFDVESTDRDQVYGGQSTNGVVIEACRATRGQVLTHEGKVLRAYFSSTCGGRTASAKDTWPITPGFEFNLAVPIQARARESACQQSPLYRWQVTRDRRELVARLRAYGEKTGMSVRGLSDLHAVEVMAKNEDGRPSKYKIVEPGGRWFQLTSEDFRLACNTSASTSGMAGGAAATTGVAIAAALTAPAPAAPPQVLPEIDRKSRVNSGDLEVRVAGNDVVISGRGFGHGVGMCQYCAKGFAERGDDWRTTVARFYPGSVLQKAY